MARVMVFIDQMNFHIALQNYYGTLDTTPPRLDYNVMPQKLVERITDAELIKTLLFIPKPDDFLMQDDSLSNFYKWCSGMKVQKNFDVVEGRYVARPINSRGEMRIGDRDSFYKVEKGSDINIAVYALRMAFFNSFDLAVFLSADTDYLPVYETLRIMGKLVNVAVVKGQYIGELIPKVDSYVNLDKNFFDSCLLKNKSD